MKISSVAADLKMPSMDAAKIKKLQEYANFLVKQAESKELHGNTSEAARDYVKLVDVLLLLANEAKDQAGWQQIIARVEYYQKKVKSLGGSSEASPEQAKVKEIQNSKNPDTSNQSANSSSLLKSFRKIPGLMGKNQPQDLSVEKLEEPQILAVQQSDSMPVENSRWMSEFSKSGSLSEIESKEQQSPHSQTYLEVISEKEKLKTRIAALEANEKDYLAAFEEIKRETERKISSMVPKEEFESVQLKLMESVPRVEYEKLKETLKEMVPKERLREAERYVSELEARLETSIPRTVLTQIEEYATLLISNSSLPLVDLESSKTPGSTSINYPRQPQGARKTISLDIDPQNQLHGSRSESIVLEIKMKEPSALDSDLRSVSMRSHSKHPLEIQEVQSELSELSGDISAQNGA